MPSLICTLFEGHYHLGAAALINSLHSHGFRGDFVCGYRGPRPFWASQATKLAPDIIVHWVEVSTPIHLTNYKPTFMRECLPLMRSGPGAALYYMDPDIVVRAPWEVFERWVGNGIALVEDLNASLPEGHPYRLRWHEFYATKGLAPARPLQRYHNAGFVGLPPAQTAFLQLWESVVKWSAQETGNLGKLKNALPHDLFHSADQDAMNMALELCVLPIHAAGPEGMDFIPGGQLLSHAAGGTKPWRGGFMADALRGRPPGLPQKFFHDYIDSPIRVLPKGLARWRRLELKLAGLIGRFYSRR